MGRKRCKVCFIMMSAQDQKSWDGWCCGGCGRTSSAVGVEGTGASLPKQTQNVKQTTVPSESAKAGTKQKLKEAATLASVAPYIL